MIRYPSLGKSTTIGITAPSSGVPEEHHLLLEMALKSMEEKSFHVVTGKTLWMQDKEKSAPARERADEFNQMMQDENIQMILPPWGGELLIEILDSVDFDALQPKWIVGYSDISTLLLAVTLKTGIATAHGTNLIDLRGNYSDKTTAMWKSVLETGKGESILQHSSEKYQKEWHHEQPSPSVFHLTEPINWQSVSGDVVRIKGRLLSGCIDTIRHLIGTPYGDVQTFKRTYNDGKPILWFLENCELSSVDLRRSLIQMKLAGWFEDSSGIMFGRSAAEDLLDYRMKDVYEDLSKELNIPILYDIDCGHVPPQLTLINGAYAEVAVEDGKATVLQTFI
ncbi:LD-carboxypeptidase [Enterococcus faecium]|nr:LD-carboxypeptidase [Enterococcus faecium]